MLRSIFLTLIFTSLGALSCENVTLPDGTSCAEFGLKVCTNVPTHKINFLYFLKILFTRHDVLCRVQPQHGPCTLDKIEKLLMGS